jgi:MoaA/NifB/PqqE/SkfB family radical SAM enzyme
MPNISGLMGSKMVLHGMRNRLRKKPLSVSFEITHSCTANCWHCNLGGPLKEERASPSRYAEILRDLDPVVVCISGGEPMCRSDVYEIVEAFSNKGGLPWIEMVSNASLLTPEKFFRLKEAGMHQYSCSLDFPDERHDEFRRIPGLFQKMDKLIPELVRSSDKDDVILNVCITNWNFRELPGILKVAKSWGVGVNFSLYSHLRVDDRSGLITGEALEDLRKTLEEIIDMKKRGYPVYNSPRDFWKFFRCAEEGGMPGCTAGDRFLVVNPDGRLTPCAMVLAYFDTQEELYEKFTKQNTCEECFIATRANTEKTLWEFVQDHGSILRDMFMPWRN